MLRVGIINVTGYAGAELARLLYTHPSVRLVSVSGRSGAGKPLGEVFPHLACYDLTIDPEASDVDFIFSALPHVASAEALAPLVRGGLPAIDISADFRLKDANEYAAWYGAEHPEPGLLAQAAYGLAELNRESIRASRLIANPGCYPVSALLALAPAVKAGVIAPDIIVDSKSGISGAGRGLGLPYHFAEADESVSAYGLNGHRHLPEITQELAGIWHGESIAGVEPRVTFTPHLIPMTRGILSTCYAPLREQAGLSKDRVRDIYREFYAGEPFVRVVDTPPATKQVRGSNMCLVYPTIDPRTGRFIAVSVIDNLVKGAAGQAVQNMNLMMGFPETAGLLGPAMYP